jgi:hypothetical protein
MVECVWPLTDTGSFYRSSRLFLFPSTWSMIDQFSKTFRVISSKRWIWAKRHISYATVYHSLNPVTVNVQSHIPNPSSTQTTIRLLNCLIKFQYFWFPWDGAIRCVDRHKNKGTQQTVNHSRRLLLQRSLFECLQRQFERLTGRCDLKICEWHSIVWYALFSFWIRFTLPKIQTRLSIPTVLQRLKSTLHFRKYPSYNFPHL